jgi:hypothetical protein
VDFIVLWSQGSVDLSDLINLINAWVENPGCELPGDYPPCGEVTLGEVINYIILWSEGEVALGDVINLINVWVG